MEVKNYHLFTQRSMEVLIFGKIDSKKERLLILY